MAIRSDLIELHNYSFRIGDRTILEDISFKVKEGEFVCIVGPNGAGKTTLLKCLDRIWRGGHGEILILGKPLRQYSQKTLAQWLAYVPQADGRMMPFTVYEFVMMGRYAYLNPFASVRREDKRVVRRALEVTGTSAFSERFFDSLSGGERQKVFLAAALAQEARILLLDEPTTFLDPGHQVEINKMLRQLNREEGITILSATHDINGGLRNSGRMIALRDGRIFYDGPSRELARNEILSQLYDHDFLIASHPQTGEPVIFPKEI